MIISRFIQTTAFLLFTLSSFGQIDFNTPVPIDTTGRTGRLENGLTYYVRHNKEPKERASFYIIQNVGALLETDDQNGLAHFLEHMAFNGTQHFPGKGIINTLQRHGVAFGRNINAYTSTGETVYNLSNVPVKHEGLVDTCLLILNDWADFLLLTDEEINAERGVITEEWRTGQSSSRRMRQQYFPVLFQGSKYAVRDVIGDTGIIRNFKPETLRKFYHDWYRTDLQAIAVVGDIDVDSVEQKIISLFSKIEAVTDPPKREFYEVPSHTEPLYVLATDKEADGYSVSMYTKHKSPYLTKNNLNYLRERKIQSLFNMMIRSRISELLQQGDPPFISGSIGYSGFVSGYEAFSVSASSKPDQDELAFRAIYTEVQRIYQNGFTPGELERAKTNLLTSIESQFKQKDKISNDQYASEFKNYYIDGEPLTSIDFDWEFAQLVLPTITLEEVSGIIKKWLKPENRVIIIMGPEKPDAVHLSKDQALRIMAEIENSRVEPYVDKLVDSNLVKQDLTGSKVKKTKLLSEYSAVEWTLENEARVVFRHADYNKDQISLSAISKGGSSKVDDDNIGSALVLSQIIGAFGVGDYDATSLKKALTGKKAGVSVNMSSMYEGFSGSSTPKDFETMMQLLYLQFENPRFDKAAYETLLSRFRASVANTANNPQKIIGDSLSLIMTNYHKRTKLMIPEFFDEISFEQIESIYKDRFADAGDFIFFIVGNIDEETARAMAEKYIGSLTNLPRKETWIDRKVEGPEGKTVREIEIPMKATKATAVINFNTKMKYTPEQNLLLSVFRDILELRYTEEIREKEGGTYGVSVSAGSSKFPQTEKNLKLVFESDPEKIQYLKTIIYQEIEKIVQSGPTTGDLDKVVKNLLKNREQAKLNNSYWMSALTTFYNYGYNSADAKNFEVILNKMTPLQVQQFAKKFSEKADIVDIVFKTKSEE